MAKFRTAKGFFRLYNIRTPVKNRERTDEMGNTKFKKGESGNPKGRPAGIPNKTTSQIREAIQILVEHNIEGLHNDLTSLDAKDRVRLIIELSRFVIPSLKATSLKVDNADFQPIIINFQD